MDPRNLIDKSPYFLSGSITGSSTGGETVVVTVALTKEVMGRRLRVETDANVESCKVKVQENEVDDPLGSSEARDWDGSFWDNFTKMFRVQKLTFEVTTVSSPSAAPVVNFKLWGKA